MRQDFMQKEITKAILPVAGMGTRFFPATKSQAKEMLAVWDTPAIQRIVEEVVEAGITEIIFVISPDKELLVKHFAKNQTMRDLLEKRGKSEALAHYDHIVNLANIHVRVQNLPLGDGHAIIQGLDLLDEGENVLVCFGDDLVDNPNGPNAAKQLLKIYESTGNSVVLLEKIDISRSKSYGMVKLENQVISGETKSGKITEMVEKPDPADAPSDLGVVGKFVITSEVLTDMQNQQTGSIKDEIRLTDALKRLIQAGGQVHGKILEGKRFDTGDKFGWLESTMYFAAKEQPEKFKNLLKKFAK